jgi:hypothetical protein
MTSGHPRSADVGTLIDRCDAPAGEHVAGVAAVRAHRRDDQRRPTLPFELPVLR